MELDTHANIIIFGQPLRITLTTTIEKERCQEQEVEATDRVSLQIKELQLQQPLVETKPSQLG